MDAASALRRLEQAEGSRSTISTDPRLRAFFECWLDTFLFQGAVDPGLREQAILRIMWRRGRAYEWSNHYRLAREAGLTDDDVLAVRCADPARELSGATKIVVQAADETVDGGRVCPSTLESLRELFDDANIVQEFLYLVAGYQMFATVSASVDAPTVDGQWLPDGIGPTTE
jgi:alkylhydroperoxidase family enzyme